MCTECGCFNGNHAVRCSQYNQMDRSEKVVCRGKQINQAARSGGNRLSYHERLSTGFAILLSSHE